MDTQPKSRSTQKPSRAPVTVARLAGGRVMVELDSASGDPVHDRRKADAVLRGLLDLHRPAPAAAPAGDHPASAFDVWAYRDIEWAGIETTTEDSGNGKGQSDRSQDEEGTAGEGRGAPARQ